MLYVPFLYYLTEQHNIEGAIIYYVYTYPDPDPDTYERRHSLYGDTLKQMWSVL